MSCILDECISSIRTVLLQIGMDYDVHYVVCHTTHFNQYLVLRLVLWNSSDEKAAVVFGHDYSNLLSRNNLDVIEFPDCSLGINIGSEHDKCISSVTETEVQHKSEFIYLSDPGKHGKQGVLVNISRQVSDKNLLELIYNQDSDQIRSYIPHIPWEGVVQSNLEEDPSVFVR